MGISLKAETDGSGGAQNVLTKEEIAAAEAIIVAADKNVEMARFDGKPVIMVPVADGIHKAEVLINQAVSGTVPIYHYSGDASGAASEGENDSVGRQIYKHLMNGVSHMLPFVIGGGILIALAFLLDDYSIDPSNFGKNTPLAAYLKTIGEQAFGMMLPILAGFIAMSIADRPGLAVGLVAGLIGGLLTIEFGIPGWGGFLFAIVAGSALAAVCGYLYALMLNRLKGSEMSVTTYVGFSIVSLMCIAWLVLPFKSLKLRWPLGTGLRNTIGLDGTNFRHILNDFLAFQIGDFTIPTGLLLFMALSCFIVWMFSRSRTGQAMQAVGNNPRFAESVGINVDKMRITGTVFSTVLGAVGILVYSQSYGFMQLYTAPRQMGFIAASAILIGGASTSRCKISHVLIGTFLFQGVLTLGMPVANVLVPGSTISETLRILISNGIILYALTKSGGESRA